MRRNQNFEKVAYVFRLLDFFSPSFSSFSFLLAAGIDLLLGLLAVRSLGSWCVKGTEESTLEVDSSVPLDAP